MKRTKFEKLEHNEKVKKTVNKWIKREKEQSKKLTSTLDHILHMAISGDIN